MGYDMYQVKQDDAQKEIAAKAREKAFALARERDLLKNDTPEQIAKQAEVSAAFDEFYKLETHYFRLNIWGMGEARDLMARYGMLCEGVESTSARDERDAAHDAAVERHGGDEDAAYEDPEFEKANMKWLGSHEGECPGIPVHKLCSNDGWWVKPAEIRPALEAFSRARQEELQSPPAEELPEWFVEWLDYLTRSMNTDGFRVH